MHNERRSHPERIPDNSATRIKVLAGGAVLAVGFGLGISGPDLRGAAKDAIKAFDGKENCTPTSKVVEQRADESDWDMARRVTGKRGDQAILQMEAANPGWEAGAGDNQTLYVPDCE